MNRFINDYLCQNIEKPCFVKAKSDIKFWNTVSFAVFCIKLWAYFDKDIYELSVYMIFYL